MLKKIIIIYIAFTINNNIFSMQKNLQQNSLIRYSLGTLMSKKADFKYSSTFSNFTLNKNYKTFITSNFLSNHFNNKVRWCNLRNFNKKQNFHTTKLIMVPLMARYMIKESMKESLENAINENYQEFDINDINKVNKNGETILISAINKNDIKTVELLLLQNNIDIEKPIEAQSKDTPLIIASKKGFEHIVKLLIKNGANVNKKNSYRENALIKAVNGGHKNIVILLIKNKAKINTKNSLEQTPLIIAVKRGDLCISKVLLDNNANIHDKDNYGKTALDYAKELGHYNLVELLTPLYK